MKYTSYPWTFPELSTKTKKGRDFTSKENVFTQKNFEMDTFSYYRPRSKYEGR